MGFFRVFDRQSIGGYLELIRQECNQISDTASLDAQVLLSHILEKPRAWILAHPEHNISKHYIDEIEISIQRLRDGEPLPYVIGEWEFFGLRFSLTPEVLIPRPETELLVEAALAWANTQPGVVKFADVGTGSGCIAVALAINVPDVSLLATDISLPALRIAQSNAQKHGVRERIDFIQSDLLSSVCDEFDGICANLPYEPSARLKTLEVYGREPALALDGGRDGVALISACLRQASRLLSKTGAIFMEIDPESAVSVQMLATESFPGKHVHIQNDYAGFARILIVRS